MSRRKILFVSQTYPDAAHRTQGTYNHALLKALASGHDVRVVAPRSWTEHGWNSRHPVRQPLAGCNVPVLYPTLWYPAGVSRRQLGRWMTWSVQKPVLRWLSGWRPDLVVSYWAHPDGETGAALAEHYRVPSAVIVGGSDVLLLPRDPQRRTSVIASLNQNTHVLCVSEGLQQATTALGIAPEKVHVLRQGINTEEFFPAPLVQAKARVNRSTHEQLALWVGRMVPVKGLETLVLAAEQLRLTCPRLRWVLIGDGPERQKVEDLCTAHGVSSIITCLGTVGHAELAHWYRAADVTVMSSLSEGLPNVLRESLACGTPFVSTHVGSVAEIAPAGMAELVPPGSVEALADGIQRVLAGSHREQVAQFVPRTWAQMAGDLLGIAFPDLSREPAAAESGRQPLVTSALAAGAL